VDSYKGLTATASGITYGNMIVAGTHPPINIDLGSNEPDMILQREYREGRYLVWRDYQVDGEAVKSPFDIDALPPGVYRLTNHDF
jgi:hypothetical protein